jgi:hypothetical protein
MRTLRQGLIVLLTLVAGCASNPSRVWTQADRNRLELSGELLDAVDAFSSRLEAAFLDAVLRKETPRRIAILAVVRNEATANARAMVLGEDPGRDLVDLYVWAKVALAGCRNKSRLAPELFCDICDATYVSLEARTSVLAGKWLQPARISRIDAAVDAFLKEHPNLNSAGLFRLIDLEDRTGIDLGADDSEEDEGMFASVNEATRAIEATRITAQQMVWLVSRMPTAIGWETQGQLDMALSSDEVTAALGNLERLNARMEALARSVDGLQSSTGELGEDLKGQGRLEGLVRRTLLLLGAVLLVVVAAATAGALLVVQRWRKPRRQASARS